LYNDLEKSQYPTFVEIALRSAVNYLRQEKAVIPQILKTLPLFWFIAILLIVRWFHGIASDPRIETIDSSFERKLENISAPSSLMASHGIGNRAAA
jgi:hypothetical protein